MASGELVSRKKHYSPSDEPEESSKRRKRHHHHRHHHSHRHRSKDDREKREKKGGGTPPESSNPNMDEDKEEGEILEEEDLLGNCGEPRTKMESDVESGEIKADDGPSVFTHRKDDHEVSCVEEHYVPSGTPEALNLSTSNSTEKRDVCLMHETFVPLENTIAEVKNDKSFAEYKFSGHREKKHDEEVSSSEKISNQSKTDVNFSGLESPVGIRRGETNFEGDSRYLRRWARSKSPTFKENLDSSKYSRSAIESRSSIYESKRHRERSTSPQKSKEKHVTVRRSPSSHDQYHDELHGQNRSRSRDHTRSDRSSLYCHERNVDSREYSRNDYDRKRGGRHNVDDFHDNRVRWRDIESDRIKRLERERSSSYNRYTVTDEKHGNRDMDFVAEKDKYRDKTGRASNHIRNEDRERERERERERGREKHGDLEKEEMKKEKRHEKSRDREIGRDIDRERRRDRSKDREKGTDVDRDRDRHRDSDKSRRSHTYGDLEDGRTSQDQRNRRRSKDTVKELNGYGEGKNKFGEEDEVDDYEERIALKLAEQEEEDIEKIKEESRKRRQAILEKYKHQQQQPQQQEDEVGDFLPDDVSKGYMPTDDKLRQQPFPSEADVNVRNGIISQGLMNKHDSSDIYVADSLFFVGKSPVQNGNIASEEISFAGGLGDGTPKSERLSDMFCDDIFGESPAVRKPGKGDHLHVERSGLNDNWDDAEGYYSYRFGEILDGRYEVTAAHGKGVFSTVVRAKDLKAGKDYPSEVAIKIIRNNDTMYKAGLDEEIILKKLAEADREDKRHCVRFLLSFNYRKHFCLVFESLHMNLREVLKKFGRNIGLKLTAVRAYAKQLFIALKHLRTCGVLHCDIKPDNMLVNEAKNVLKLCDFGNAMLAGKNDITPYLVSRFYRAPEIILGLPYDHPMDMWSVGCCLYELYTGKVLFPGPSNNDMLRLHMELKGPFPKKMLRKGAFTDQHFDQDLNFYATEEDPVTKKTVKRLLVNMKPKDIGLLISSSPGEDPKMVANFKDLLDKIFVLDPDKRLTVSQALSHPFITGK